MSIHASAEYNLDLSHLELVKEWHPTKNGSLHPGKVTPGSTRKVWWRCFEGHEWECRIAHRVNGSGCPYCSGRLAIPGVNDLFSIHPELAKEWHPTRNTDLCPTEILPKSDKKVWWICSACGHEWQTAVKNRSNGRGCPRCKQEKFKATRFQNLVLKNGSLLETHPVLAAEWHPTKNKTLLPSQFIATSHQKVWWQCAEGHEWQTEIRSRAVDGCGCPACAGQAVIVGVNDLLTLNPLLAAEWHPTKNLPLTPSNIMPKSGKKVWWICSEGHDWQASPRQRRSGSDGCPICSGHRVLKGFNDLASKRPILASEWHPTKNGDLIPQKVTAGSSKTVWWQCYKGHEWRSSICNRNHGNGCPECAKETQTSFPEQAIFFYFRKIGNTFNRYQFDKKTEIDIYLPEFNFGIEYDGYTHRSKAAQKRDAKKDEVLSAAGISLIRAVEVEQLDALTDSTSVIYCKYSAYNFEYLNELIIKLISRFNSFSSQNITVDVDVDRDQWDIYAQYIESEKQNSLLAKRPDLAAEWHPTKNGKLLPSQISYGANRKVWWMCSKGHEWQTMIGNRSKGKGCPYCVNRKILVGFNDLATTHAEISAEWHPAKNGALTPFNVTKGTDKKVWWLGKCGHEWDMKISNRTYLNQNCPYCSGLRPVVGVNDLTTTHPELATEWHPIKNVNPQATIVKAGSHRKVWWLGKCGHEWQATVRDRCRGRGCPICREENMQNEFSNFDTPHRGIFGY